LNSFGFFRNAEAYSSLGSTKLIATEPIQLSNLRLKTDAASAQGANDARLSSRKTASVVIRVWTQTLYGVHGNSVKLAPCRLPKKQFRNVSPQRPKPAMKTKLSSQR